MINTYTYVITESGNSWPELHEWALNRAKNFFGDVRENAYTISIRAVAVGSTVDAEVTISYEPQRVTQPTGGRSLPVPAH